MLLIDTSANRVPISWYELTLNADSMIGEQNGVKLCTYTYINQGTSIHL